MVAAVTRIVRAVRIPVTADMEAGYGLEPADLADRLLGAGAAGCNLEDSDPVTGVEAEREPLQDLAVAEAAAEVVDRVDGLSGLQVRRRHA